MKKSSFINLLLGTVGGLIFGLGVCATLLEWAEMTIGAGVIGVGIIVLLATLIHARKSSEKKLHVNGKLVGKILYGVVSALVLGVGMCMIMEFDMMILGIIVGVVGIVMLLGLIPLCLGLK